MFRWCAYLQGVLLISSLALGQDTYRPEEVRVTDLPSVTAKSSDPSDVLAASVETMFHKKDLCCGKDSVLEDRVLGADPRSLKDVAARLGGRQHLSDGRPITVRAEFWPAAEANSGAIVAALRDRHPLLMLWDSHLYVVSGVVYNDASYSGPDSTQEIYVIQKFLLLDLRYSDIRREKEFVRGTDDWNKVKGLLLLDWTRQ